MEDPTRLHWLHAVELGLYLRSGSIQVLLQSLCTSCALGDSLVCQRKLRHMVFRHVIMSHKILTGVVIANCGLWVVLLEAVQHLQACPALVSHHLTYRNSVTLSNVSLTQLRRSSSMCLNACFVELVP